MLVEYDGLSVVFYIYKGSFIALRNLYRPINTSEAGFIAYSRLLNLRVVVESIQILTSIDYSVRLSRLHRGGSRRALG